MKIQNILIAGDYKAAFHRYLPKLKDYKLLFKQPQEIETSDLNWADAYVGFTPSQSFHPEYVEWVHTFNAGVNNYLQLNGWNASKTLLTRTVTDFGQKMAEYCLSYILKETQQHERFSEQQSNKQWSVIAPTPLKEVTVTIFGTGAIGQKMAEIFSLLGITVYGISNSGEQKDYFKSVTTVTQSSQYIEVSDYIISTLPLTPETNHLLNDAIFKSFDKAMFINVGRGQVVDTKHLIRALNNGNVRHAILDVVDKEPLPIDSLLWDRGDITITPHISALTDIDDAIACFYETLQNIENKKRINNKVNFQKGY